MRDQLFLRTTFRLPDTSTEEQLTDEFGAVAREFGMTVTIRGDRTPECW